MARGQNTLLLKHRRGQALAAAGLCMAITAAGVQAGTLTGSVELGYERGRLETGSQPDVNSREVSERLNLDYDGTLYRPWIGNFRVGGTWGQTDMNRDGQDTELDLSAYRLQGKLLPRSPFPLSLHLIQNDTQLAAENATDSELTSRMYGADLLLDFRALPTTNIFHFGQESRSNFAATPSEQESDTSGVQLHKRWRDLSAQLRYEHSAYHERLADARADSDRLATSWVYRPSSSFQASLVGATYDRTGSNPLATGLDPLYSDRRSDSGNVSLVWDPDERLNVNAGTNYFAEVYEDSDRRADDTRLGVSYQLTPHLATFGSAYAIHTRADDERFDSRDTRVGVSYSRNGSWRSLALRGSASAGYFRRESEPETETGNESGAFYQTGAGVQRPFRAGTVTLTPYYDASYGRFPQTLPSDAVHFTHEAGLRADGRLGRRGHLAGNASHRRTRQRNGLDVRSEQSNAYLSYLHNLRRATVRLRAGYSESEGRVTGDLFASFTAEQTTWYKNAYLRANYKTAIGRSGLSLRLETRAERREGLNGRTEDIDAEEASLSQQYGKLFYETGFYRRGTEIEGVESTESLWFIRIRRDITSSFGGG